MRGFAKTVGRYEYMTGYDRDKTNIISLRSTQTCTGYVRYGTSNIRHGGILYTVALSDYVLCRPHSSCIGDSPTHRTEPETFKVSIINRHRLKIPSLMRIVGA